jgi:hypothetical protein
MRGVEFMPKTMRSIALKQYGILISSSGLDAKWCCSSVYGVYLAMDILP